MPHRTDFHFALRYDDLLPATWAAAAAFGTYFCMYGFRKPFTAAGFEGAEVWGAGFWNVAVFAQVLGSMLSRFIGSKVIAEVPSQRRAGTILVLITAARDPNHLRVGVRADDEV